MAKLVGQWWLRVQQFINRPWYVALVSLLAGLDLFILVVPSDGLMISAVLARRERWVSTFLWVTTGSALGALLLTGLIQGIGAEAMESLLPSVFNTEGWSGTEAFLASYGAVALALLALSPLPQQPGVVLAALADMPPLVVFLAVWLGRAVKYGLFAWLAAYAPSQLRRFWVVRRELEELEGNRPGK